MTSSKILIGNGTFSPSPLFFSLAQSSDVIAVDGGANTCKRHNIMPKKIIGDLDSITSENKKFFTEKNREIIQIEEQDSTDLEKALRTVDADIFYCFGFTGNFFDHELSLLHILQKNHYGKYGTPKKIIMFSETQIFFVLEKQSEISLSHIATTENRISFYPLSPTKFISSSGLQYPLDGLTLQQGDIIGTSNSQISHKISWKIEKGCCLGFFPIEYSSNILQHFYDTSLD